MFLIRIDPVYWWLIFRDWAGKRTRIKYFEDDARNIVLLCWRLLWNKFSDNKGFDDIDGFIQAGKIIEQERLVKSELN